MSSIIAPYLKAQQVVDASNSEEAEHALKTYWNAKSFNTPEGGRGFRSIGRKRRLKRFDMAYCYYNRPSETCFGELPFVRQQFVLGGSGNSVVGRREFSISTTQTCTLAANASTKLSYSAEYQQLIFRIPVETLETFSTVLLGARPRHRLYFNPVPLAGQRLERLRRFALIFAEEAGDPDLPSVLADELEDTFLTYFLTCNENSYRDRLLEPPASTTPRHVAMVEEHIVANWDKPFTIEDISAFTGVAARTIYATFKQYRGYGPKAFLRQTRLNKARELLQQGRYDVATVARMCCFPSTGRFARYYRAAFGELPSDTRR